MLRGRSSRFRPAPSGSSRSSTPTSRRSPASKPSGSSRPVDRIRSLIDGELDGSPYAILYPRGRGHRRSSGCRAPTPGSVRPARPRSARRRTPGRTSSSAPRTSTSTATSKRSRSPAAHWATRRAPRTPSSGRARQSRLASSSEQRRRRYPDRERRDRRRRRGSPHGGEPAGVGRRGAPPRQPLRPVGTGCATQALRGLARRQRRARQPVGAPRRGRRRRRAVRRLLRRRRPAPRAARLRRTTMRRHSRSRVTYKGALNGEGARTVWVGDVLIAPSAPGTDTYEQNRNLVLSEGTRADSIPNLEIETGDIVGAGHASATGRFDDEHLFYLQSRGITERRGAPAGRARLPQRDRAEDRRAGAADCVCCWPSKPNWESRPR